MKNNNFKFISFVLLSLNLCASVELTAPKYIYKKEALEFAIVAKGFEIKPPEITTTNEYLIEKLKSSQEATLIDNRKATKLTITYRLYPKKTLVLPSFKFLIDDKVEATHEKKVLVKKAAKTISKDFDLQMYVDNNKLFIGEKTLLHIVFSYGELEDYEFSNLNFDDVELKQLSSKEFQRAEGKEVEEVLYQLKALRSGLLRLHPAKVEVKIYKNKHTKRIAIYSNALKLKVLALPENTTVIGRYTLSASIDKVTVHEKEPLTLTVTLNGNGNIDNLDSLHLKIKNATIYENKTKKNGDGNQIKTFQIIANKDYIIPSFELKYFDKTTNSVKKTVTKNLKVDILEDNNTTVQKETTMTEKILFYFLGLVTAGTIFILYKVAGRTKNIETESQLIKAIHKCQSDDELFKMMVPYLGTDRKIDKIIYQLETKKGYEFKELKKRLLLRLNEME